MARFHRTTPRAARSILEDGFDPEFAPRTAGCFWVGAVCDPDSADNTLAGGDGALVVLVIDIPDDVVRANTARPDELDERGALVPADVLNQYPIHFCTYQDADEYRDDPDELRKYASIAEKTGKQDLAGHLRDLADFLPDFLSRRSAGG